jgi:hypothetical protein
MAQQDRSRPLEELSPYPEFVYSSIDLNRLACFILRWLQERHVPMTFENIVVAAFRMFPAKFSLEGFSEYPDAARTNRALLQLRPKYRNWARGNVGKGFVLTESGLAEAGRVRDILISGKAPEKGGRVRRQKPKTMDLTRDLGTVVDSGLFSKWREQRLGEGTILELLDMLQAYVYTPPKALRERIEGIENAAIQVGRADVAEFLREVRRTFDKQFRGPRKGE